MIVAMALASPAFGQESSPDRPAAGQQEQPVQDALPKSPVNIGDIKPIPPSEVVKTAEEVSSRIVGATQGVALPFVPVCIVAAAVLLLVGAAGASLTKSFLKAGVGLLTGLLVAYVLVFHYSSIIGFLKGMVHGS